MGKHIQRFGAIFPAALIVAGIAVAAFAEDAASVFPTYGNGVRAIFNHNFPFVTQKAEINPFSVPPTKMGNGVRLLNEGPDRLKWRLEMAERARKTLRVQTYIFSADEAGKLVADTLKRRRNEGLDVRLTIDTYTKFRPRDRRQFNALELAGVTIMGFEPWYLLGTTENRLLDFKDVNMRFHEKYWIADDSVAIVGGANVANEYFRYGDNPDDMWRDQDVLLAGPVVYDVIKAFDDNQKYFAMRRNERFWFNRATFFRGPWWELTDSRPPEINNNHEGEAQPPSVADLDDVSVPVRFIRHRPRYKEDYIFQAYLYLIDSARESIVIENAYFVPNRQIITALMRAARRGVRVVVVTNSMDTNDVSGMQPLSRYTYQPLMNFGVEIYEWQGDHPEHGSLHSKAAVFDGVVSVIGSCNLDPRSFDVNSENVVILDSVKIAKALTDYVMNVDLSNSKRVTPEQAKKWRNPRRNDQQFRLEFGKTMESWY